MSSTDNALTPGTLLHGANVYRIERVLGAGGFGITYLASFTMMVGNMSVRAYVAVKEHFLRAQCERGQDGSTVVCPGTQESRAMTANSLKDFIAEARRLCQYGANHPNIVKVNDVIETNDTAYYVMEFLEGKSLQEYMHEHGPLSEDEIRQLVYPIIDATAYLHRQMVTHLDIKPGNIMLAKKDDGSVRPVLIDFGLSKHYNADGSATSTVNTMACSEGFAPMEQYSGIDTFSPAADVYALGATLYNTLSGRLPVKSSSWPSGEPAATIDKLPIDEKLKRVIKKALAPMAADRYPDAGAMLADLGVSSAASEGTPAVKLTEKKQKNETVPLPAPTSSSEQVQQGQAISPEAGVSVKSNKSFIRVGLAAIAVVLILAIGGYLMFRNPGTQEEPQDEVLIAEAEEQEILTADEVQQTEPDEGEHERLRQEAEAPQRQHESTFEDAVAAYNSRNYNRAKELFQSISSDARAQNYLGKMYREGWGVGQDYSEAVRWFRLAANQGLASAQSNLGYMYDMGRGVGQDYSEAERLYRLAANQGDAYAHYNLGYMYHNGRGVSQSYSEAVRWYQLAANQGLASAQNNLGYMYREGLGVGKDYSEAVRWFRLAANQGNAQAQSNLGSMYKDGWGVSQDFSEAVRWYRLAASQGNPSAQCCLGWMYEVGQGVPQDIQEAIRLYRLSAAQGYGPAIDGLLELGVLE